jgi:hypothetical protein
MTNFYDILEPGEREAEVEQRYESLGLSPPRPILGWHSGEVVGFRKETRIGPMPGCRVCGKALTLPGYAAIGRHPRCWG